MMNGFKRNYLTLAVMGLFSLAALSLEAHKRKFDEKVEKENKGSELVVANKKQRSGESKQTISFSFQLPDALVTYMLEFCNTKELLNQLLLVSKQFYQSSFPAVHSLDWFHKKDCFGKDGIILERLAKFKKIKSLNLEYCYDLTDEDLKIIVKHCPGLQSINLYWCDKITDEGLSFLAEHCRGLQSINLTWCKKVTDQGLKFLVEHCRGLQNINLSWCKKITDEGLSFLAEHCRGLQNINLDGCDKITNAGLKFLVEHCPGLQSINLTWCDQITNAELRFLVERCENLQVVYLYGANQITTETKVAIEAILGQRKNQSRIPVLFVPQETKIITEVKTAEQEKREALEKRHSELKQERNSAQQCLESVNQALEQAKQFMQLGSGYRELKLAAMIREKIQVRLREKQEKEAFEDFFEKKPFENFMKKMEKAENREKYPRPTPDEIKTQQEQYKAVKFDVLSRALQEEQESLQEKINAIDQEFMLVAAPVAKQPSKKRKKMVAAGGAKNKKKQKIKTREDLNNIFG